MSLHIEERGAGIPIVLLHGLPSPPADLLDLSADFPDCRFIVPHFPGYAPAPCRPGSHGTAAIEAALLETISQLELIRPILVGYSMGGYRALSLALRLPVRGVFVLAGFADLSPEERTGMRDFAAALRAGINLRHVAGPRFLSDAHRAAQPGDISKVEAWLDLATPETIADELEDLAVCPSLLPHLHSIQSPVVLRTGMLDIATPPIHAENIARQIPQATLEMVHGKGHALLYEDRQGVVESLRRLVDATY